MLVKPHVAVEADVLGWEGVERVVAWVGGGLGSVYKVDQETVAAGGRAAMAEVVHERGHGVGAVVEQATM